MTYKYLTILNTLLLRLSPHNTLLHYTWRHFTSSHLHFATLSFFKPIWISYRSTSLHFTSLHFTSLHFTSLHFTSLHFRLFSPHFNSFHFTTFIFASLTLFLKILILQGNSLTLLQVVGSSFYGPNYKEIFSISVLCFLPGFLHCVIYLVRPVQIASYDYSQIFTIARFLNFLDTKKISRRIFNPSSRKSHCLTFTVIYFYPIFYCPFPQGVQILLKILDVVFMSNVPTNYTVITE